MFSSASSSSALSSQSSYSPSICHYILSAVTSLVLIFNVLSSVEFDGTDAVLRKEKAAPVDVINGPIVNPFKFKYLHEPACPSDMDFLIWVHTAVGSFQKRQALRATWANARQLKGLGLQSRVFFFLGVKGPGKVAGEQAAFHEGVAYESEKYGDVIQADFIDSYRNLTYKAMMGIKWINTHCDLSRVKLILKADDDMVVDIIPMTVHVANIMKVERGRWRHNTIFCDVWRNRYVFREKGKWMVTKEEFAEDVYPTYCPGLALLMTPDVVPTLWARAERTPYFWVDDVFFTGLLTRATKIQFYNFNAQVHFGANPLVAMTVEDHSIYFRHTWPYRTRHFYGLWLWITGKSNCTVTEETRHGLLARL